MSLMSDIDPSSPSLNCIGLHLAIVFQRDTEEAASDHSRVDDLDGLMECLLVQAMIAASSKTIYDDELTAISRGDMSILKQASSGKHPSPHQKDLPQQ